MSIKMAMAKSAFWSSAGAISNQIFAFVVMAIVARLITPANFGLVSLALIFLEFSKTVVLGGLPEALVREKTWNDETANAVFWANLGMGLGFTLITAVVGGLIAVNETGIGIGHVLAILSPGFLIDSSAAVHEAKLKHDFQFKKLAFRLIVTNVVAGTVSIAMAFTAPGVWPLIAQRLVSSALQAAIVWRASRWTPGAPRGFAALGPVLSFSLPMMGSRLVGQLAQRGADIIIAAVGGVAALGIYRVASRGMTLLTQLTINPLQTVALSAFSKVKDASAVARSYVQITRLTSLLTFPMFLGLAVIAPDFIEACFGARWRAAAPVMSILSLSVGTTALTYFAVPALAAVGASRMILRQNVAALVAVWSCAAVFSHFGVASVAAGQVLSSYLVIPVYLAQMKRAVGLSFRQAMSGTYPPLVAAGVMAGCLWALRLFALHQLSPLARMAIVVPLGVLLYGAIMVLGFRRHLRTVIVDVEPVLPANLPAPLRRLLSVMTSGQ
ncbi:lipopolysaccharide biosynthesis protein [Phenylobacterium sp.]|uniref:lipopolysaccharide biosynthesis protein n=1 Tax=Phenylobacterium sp. TaxID=1871053 RepID=UPI002F4196A1